MKNKLREIREKLEITQDDLVKKSGISRTTISAIENNEEYVTTNKTLEKIAEALKLNVPDIFLQNKLYKFNKNRKGKNMTILQLISTENFISVNKELIKLLGLEEAIILGELASEYEFWNRRGELDQGFFYSTIENIEKNTTLSVHKQRKALNNLKEKGLIEIKVKGIPAKRYIKIIEKQVYELLSFQFVKNSQTSLSNFEHTVSEKLSGNNNINNNKIIVVDKENEKSQEYLDEINTEPKKVLLFYEQNIGLLSPFILEDIEEYQKQISEELIIEAIKRAVESGKRNWRYAKGILNNWLSQNIKTLPEVEQNENEYKNKKNSKPINNTANKFIKKGVYEDETEEEAEARRQKMYEEHLKLQEEEKRRSQNYKREESEE